MRPIIASANNLITPSNDINHQDIHSHTTNKPVTDNIDTTMESDNPPLSQLTTTYPNHAIPPQHTISASHNHVPTISVLVHSAIRPTTTANIQDCFDATNPLRSSWIQTVYEQFDKNASYKVFTRPIKKTSLPTNIMILRSVLTPSVKPTDIPQLWKLNIRHCVSGKPMKGMIEYGATRASTVHPDTVRFQLAFCTSKGFTHRPFDCTNAFQCTFEDDPAKRI